MVLSIRAKYDTTGGSRLEATQVSLTAMLTAFARAYHSSNDEPKIFDDFLAMDILTAQERAYLGRSLANALSFFDPESVAACPDEETALARVMQIQSLPVTTSRSRYTEEALEAAVAQGARQYVILGAGLDTFAYRRPDLLSRLVVFEIDHPGTQAFKRQRVAELGWECPANLHFVPVDFTKEDLATVLRASAFDPTVPCFCSWLGVTYYLPREALFATLRSFAAVAAPGGAIVFDFINKAAFEPGNADAHAKRAREITQRAGEPMQTALDPQTLATELADVGLELVECLSPAEIQTRFFAGRTERYKAPTHTWFAKARVK